ncbi:ATP-binding protein [Gilvimarinus sp. SDUM040013]|uniref:histidine kinase n=1 Tax=Gilvimarinus gilvus TaxID=3058038 RepID=A0ABU4RXS2_9GAMM|nr:ATP-binding protein [Gilvimarinus sp. SDUM040013]MDO3386449.1 ATP-binding protein [Gilvimarinus sp. SDUM040013]MDX6849715.1 ATP-binding protein [Gilvimarinus sp. SDUM040013]
MLKRAFFTLYLLVVVAILLAGWGLDRLQQSISTEAPISATEAAFLRLITEQTARQPDDGRLAFVQAHLQRLGLNARAYRLSDLADSGLGDALASGEPLVLDSDDGRELYVKLGELSLIVRIELPDEAPASHRVLLIGFYIFLAIVIYLWVWPLVRDLKSLEAQAKQFGRGEHQGVQLNQSSPVYSLAGEFNRMQERIDELLTSYREMTYAVSHELRTPLARMKFALELAESVEQMPHPVQRQLLSLRQDVADMDDLINQLFSYAGFESQSQSLVQRPGAADALAALAEQQIKRIQEQYPHIDIEVEDRLGLSELWCEWHLFERILQNLLGNARRYAEKQIRVELYSEDLNYVVAVEDDGPGVPAHDRLRIFDSFIRLKQQPGKDSKGFGLGLAIVRRIMGWHQGTVRVVDGSTLGGARFECRWPMSGASD